MSMLNSVYMNLGVCQQLVVQQICNLYTTINLTGLALSKELELIPKFNPLLLTHSQNGLRVSLPRLVVPQNLYAQ